MGPGLAHSRAFLRTVWSITTDQGTERLLADLSDLLPASTSVLLCRKRLGLENGFFPHCVGSPGWNLVCDGLIQTGINFLRWVPRWLDLLESLNRVLRDHRKHFIEDLERDGQAGAATLVAESSHLFFATRRWHLGSLLCIYRGGSADSDLEPDLG